MRSALALVVAGAPFACVLPEFDPLGLPCPCAEEYVCDEASNTCVAGPLNQGAAGTGAAGGGGSSGGHGAGAAGAGGAGGAGGGGGVALSPLEFQGDIGSGSLAFVELDGEEIARGQRPVADRALARFEPADGSVLPLHGGTIPSGEPFAARTLTVTP